MGTNSYGNDNFYNITPEIEKILKQYTFGIVNEAKNVNFVIDDIINELGRYYQLSRISVFEHEISGKKQQITYEWRNDDIVCLNYDSEDLSKIDYFEYIHRFDKNGVFYCNDVTVPDTENIGYQLYEKAGIKALVQFAIYDGDTIVGAMNYEDCSSPRRWSTEEKNDFYTFTKLINSYFVRLRNKQELENENFFKEAILNNQKLISYAIKDGTYELLYCSKYTSSQFQNLSIGKPCYNALYGRNEPCDLCPISNLEFNNCISYEAYDKNEGMWLSTTASKVMMPNKQMINLVCTSDATGFMERVHSRDYLTGLYTLSGFIKEAMKIISEPSDYSYAILYADFDKFKNINDEWGYSTGDEVLVYFSKLLTSSTLSSEISCRISDDKFLVLLKYRKREEILHRIDITNDIIINDFDRRFSKIKPIIIGGLYYLKPEDKVLSLAIDKANLARKTIKGVHKSRIAVYDHSLHMQLSREKMIENHMYDALNNNEFIVFMQPKIDLKTNGLIGAEALVRWKKPSGEIVGPNEFIPIFERNGFISELDFYVYEKTMIYLRKWLDMGKKPLVISINVSKVHLYDSNFIQKLEKLVEKYNIPANLIELELTESIFFKGLDRLVNIINYMREKGFLISIDDFGSGYSSLNLLKTLPVDILKIDGDFFKQNQMGEHEKIIISSIITLAKGLGLKVISEGIETEEQVNFLKENSCDMAQGYWFYRPMPMLEFMNLIE